MIRLEGKVVNRRPDGLYEVEFKKGDKAITLACYISGRWKYRYRHAKVMVGDRVLVELNPYDKEKGKIIRKVR